MNRRPKYGMSGCLMFMLACGLCLWVLPQLGRLLLLGGGLIGLAVIALVVALVVYSLNGGERSGDKISTESLSADQATLITNGKARVISIRSILGRIKNTEIRDYGYSICRTCDKIFKALIEQPKSITAARQFLTYYLPTINLVLEKYEKVEKSGTDSGNMSARVINYLKDVDKALDKFYQKLFEDEKLDLTVEMEAMTMAVKRDGLITDDELRQELSATAKADARDISLSL
ncbi:MAG: 5-bromo-4-chloroindolyl phosphate hydrolysis family protein [Oscillospiraceae bacterium]|nr:5-bromo-4-chloroindolyl phosphate hydrolysis family protein [Oscillospiraceae bacterium]